MFKSSTQLGTFCQLWVQSEYWSGPGATLWASQAVPRWLRTLAEYVAMVIRLSRGNVKRNWLARYKHSSDIIHII